MHVDTDSACIVQRGLAQHVPLDTVTVVQGEASGYVIRPMNTSSAGAGGGGTSGGIGGSRARGPWKGAWMLWRACLLSSMTVTVVQGGAIGRVCAREGAA
jgi:hypothetical protein